jgi:hypothetical protein
VGQHTSLDPATGYLAKRPALLCIQVAEAERAQFPFSYYGQSLVPEQSARHGDVFFLALLYQAGSTPRVVWRPSPRGGKCTSPLLLALTAMTLASFSS